MLPVMWILEAEMFPETHSAMCAAVLATGCDLLPWRDDWLTGNDWPDVGKRAVVFHGSLGNASAIRSTFPWRPGAYCNTGAFRCSSWYPQAKDLLLHEQWRILPAIELVTGKHSLAASLGGVEEIFVRPDSPLKPFSGRVVPVEGLSLRSLDFGFYFEDESLPVVVAPVREITREWRYVVVNGTVIAGSAYEATRREAVPISPLGESWRFAESVAKQMPAPEVVYILDICEADDRLHVLELNPFSGADLYACDREAVVRAVADLARESLG